MLKTTVNQYAEMEKFHNSLYAEFQKIALINKHFRANSRKVGKIEKFTIYFSSEMFETCSNFLETIDVGNKHVIEEISVGYSRKAVSFWRLENDVNINQYQMIKRFVYDQLGVDE